MGNVISPLILGSIPLTAYQVLTNCKTKIYKDGSRNSIACRVPMFRPDSVETESSVYKKHLAYLAHEDIGDELREMLQPRNITFVEFYEMMMNEPVIFVENLEQIHLSVSDFTYCNSLFNSIYPQSRYNRGTRNNDEPRSDSVKRAKDSIFDYVLNNEFEYFFTGTIDPSKLDSKDPFALLKPVTKWLKNMVQNYDLHYVMVAERHKKGGIHFHGLFYGDSLRLTDSGTKVYKGHKRPMTDTRAYKLGLFPCDGRTVYNLDSWRFGFSTVVPLQGDRLYTAFYITKYITKDCKKIFGSFYWHSRNIDKPQVIYENVDYDSLESAEFNGFKYQFRRGSDNEI